MKLIFVVGKKRAGKDTLADFVTERYNGEKYQFGGPIKDILYKAWQRQTDVFPLKRDDFHGYGIDREMPLAISRGEVHSLLSDAVMIAAAEYGLKYHHDALSKLEAIVLNNIEAWTIRRLMQTLGTDLCVYADKMVWVRLFASEYIEAIGADMPYFVVPDTRQENEIAVGRAMGATIVHVVGADLTNSDNHITERGLPVLPGDAVIENTGTLEEFHTKIIDFLETIQ